MDDTHGDAIRHGLASRSGATAPLHGRRWSLVGLAALALAACGPYPGNTFAPTSDYADDIKDLFVLIIYACLAVFIVVEAVLIYAAFKFRGKPGDPRPAPLHGNTRLEIIWTALPVVILFIIGIPTVVQIFHYQADAPPGAMEMTAIGHQWWFEFRYDEQKFQTANEAHVPTGRPVRVALESKDVLHSWWPPKLAGKRDMIPNHVNYVWFTAHTTGPDFGSCTEFCGESHAKMGFDIVVDTPQDFDTWVKQQLAVPQAPTDPQLQQGAKVFQSSGCGGCHTIAGTQGAGQIGPNLTHVGSRQTIAGASLKNTPENLTTWIRNPAATKPGEGVSPNTMPPSPNMSQQDLASLVAYLTSLK